MTMAWYPHFMADYESDTTHLSLMEHGAYRLLLDHYYKKRSPLPANASLLHRVCRAFASEEQAAVQTILDEFFILREDGYHQKRADQEIVKANEISAKRSAAANVRHKGINGLQPKTPAPNGTKASDLGDASAVQMHSKSKLQNHASAVQMDTHLTTHNSQEEGEGKPPPAKRKKKRSPLYTSAPDVLPVTDAMRAWAAEKYPSLDPDSQTEKFLDKARAKAWEFADWVSAWRSWMAKAKEFADKDAQKDGTAPAPRALTIRERMATQ